MKTTILTACDDSFQASVLQGLLENESIESFLKNENISSLYNIPGFKIEVYVFEEDYERAVEISEKAFPHLFK